ncbi:sulfite exporter TauE/SafE family protein, partial [bacterium]|nr:sulfite exporter TauE/SafE family protein [bacterium]
MTTGKDPTQTVTPEHIPLHVRFWYSVRFGVLRKLLTVWAVTIVLAFITIYSIQKFGLKPEAPEVVLWSGTFFLIALVALVCEYADSTLGMGYGTTLTPVLLLFGYEPLVVVPAILVSELITGLSGAVSHKEAGNIDLSKNSSHLKIAL